MKLALVIGPSRTLLFLLAGFLEIGRRGELVTFSNPSSS
jgi:hypothetical protein